MQSTVLTRPKQDVPSTHPVQSARRAAWFRRLALAGALLAATVVVLGAWVRLTDAGLGCPDWPGCYGHLYPQVDHGFGKALHEMIHRYFAGALISIIAGLLAWAVWDRKNRDQPLLPVAFLFVIVCLQGTLGALTVTRLLKPLIVTAHLLGGLTTLAILWWLSLTPETGSLEPRASALRKLALASMAVLALQIALGGWTSSNYAAVACPDLPTCQQSWWPPMDFGNAFALSHGMDIDYTGGVLGNPARTAIHVTHRLGAIIVGCVLTTLGLLCIFTAQRHSVKTAGALVLFAVLLQIGIGLSMVHFAIPLALADLHNAGAAFAVISMMTLLRRLWPVRTA
jgi:cytochrome c oxidase assembly protein subunit 15